MLALYIINNEDYLCKFSFVGIYADNLCETYALNSMRCAFNKLHTYTHTQTVYVYIVYHFTHVSLQCF